MLSKMSKENLEMLSYAKIAELYLKENKKPMNTADLLSYLMKSTKKELVTSLNHLLLLKNLSYLMMVIGI